MGFYKYHTCGAACPRHVAGVAPLPDGTLELRLRPIHLALIEALGIGGCSRAKEIKEQPAVRHALRRFSEASILPEIKDRMRDLIRWEIVKDARVSLGARGYIYRLFELTKEGADACVALFGRPPVDNEAQQLIAQHDSIEHGLLIKEAAGILERLGYRTRWRPGDAPHVRIRTTGKAIRPDVLASRLQKVEPMSESTVWVECERGTHNRQDFFAKLDNYLELQRPLYLVCPNKRIQQHLVNLIVEYRKRRAAVGDPRILVACLSTLNDLKSGTWLAI